MNQADDDPSPLVSETLHWESESGQRDLTGKTLGDFHVQRLLGRGGMGEVYLALQVSLNRPVALKVLRPELLKRANYLGRFEAEAAAVAKLNHPNIVHVYTLGEVDGVRFIAMEYVQGTNLREYIKKKGALDYPLALSVMRQAALAVGAAGEIGLVHRDIKPENILLTRKGQVKVADFGLCRDTDADALALTQPGVTMGTPLYMSPEQAQGLALDHRSDLYSLGVTFYHMIGGVPPFRADHPLAVAMKHVKNTPASLTVHRPDVPPAIDRIVLKLMAKSPGDRYQSAAEMLRDLSKARESLGPAAPSQPSVEVSVPTLTGMPAAPAPSGPSAARGAAGLTSGVAAVVEAGPVAVEAGPGWFGPWAKAGLIAAGLLAGVGAGWSARPENLLAEGAPAPEGPPALWMAPRWRDAPRMASPEAQYREAQFRAPIDGAAAAWLAVPGHFPDSREWASRAYSQLAGLWLRRRDPDRLEALADDIERWDRAQTREAELVAVARVGVKALRGDVDGVLNDFDKVVVPSKMTDPSLIDLALDAALQAERTGARAGAPPIPALALQRLRDVQRELLPRLLLNDFRGPAGPRPRPGRPEPPAGSER